jgi:hypothetical protein
VAHLGLSALFLLAASVARHRGGARTLLYAVVAAGAVEGVLGLASRATGTHAILGIFEPVFRERIVIGTFINHNHTAGVLTLTSIPAIALAAASRPLGRVLVASAGAVAASAIFVTGSRGSLVGLAAGFVITIALLAHTSTARRYAGGIALGGVLIGGTFFALNAEVVTSRFRAERSAGPREKVLAWRDAVAITEHFPLTGIGRGAYQEVAPHYKGFTRWVRNTHPESWPLQWSAEWGLPVTIALMILAGFALARRLLFDKPDSSAVAAAGGLTAIAAQNLFDFNLEFYGCAAPAAVLLGVLAARRGAHETPHPTLAPWVPPAVLVAGAGALAGYLAFAAPQGYLLLDRNLARLDAAALDAAVRAHPADFRFHLERGRRRAATEPDLARLDLSRAAFLDPNHPAPHLELARLLVARGRKASAALEYRATLERRPDAAVVDEITRRCTDPADVMRALPANRALIEHASRTSAARSNLALEAALSERLRALPPSAPP